MSKPRKKKAGVQEIERKFLVAEPPADDLTRYASRTIEQGYLAADPERKVEVRLRRRDKRCFLTIKQGDGLERVEVEMPLRKAEFNALWPATEGRRITKTRYRIPKKGSAAQSIELDIYAGELTGLRVVEVEFADEETARAFQPLAWFGREVTGEPAYRNAELARHGRPEAE